MNRNGKPRLRVPDLATYSCGWRDGYNAGAASERAEMRRVLAGQKALDLAMLDDAYEAGRRLGRTEGRDGLYTPAQAACWTLAGVVLGIMASCVVTASL